ncbi:endonuclease/exonuclease/phosphatase family protein [Limibacterium fermenti]|jgi:endonuclease/exonuclease/phosphatase family metal-dependent hydrolase|uniref:endonuclease/exonuclease/phosphatase family protein n=1 Tax=Limibacterium fermenti TaxID=3229863 RepID=UPI0026806DB9
MKNINEKVYLFLCLITFFLFFLQGEVQSHSIQEKGNKCHKRSNAWICKTDIANLDSSVTNKQQNVAKRISETVAVMTYNIYGARPNGIQNIEEIAKVITQVNPDLVALQEVDKYTQRNAHIGDVAKRLAEITGMHYFFSKAIDFDGGEYGDAVLSKLPIKGTKSYMLGTTPELPGENRSVARVTVEKGGTEFYFISTHFDHLNKETNRVKQARDFVNILKKLDKPVIVGGDLNDVPDSKTISILREHLLFGDRNDLNSFTFPTSTPSQTIDYLMYFPNSAFRINLYRVYTPASITSDHFPVIAIFKINSK